MLADIVIVPHRDPYRAAELGTVAVRRLSSSKEQKSSNLLKRLFEAPVESILDRAERIDGPAAKAVLDDNSANAGSYRAYARDIVRAARHLERMLEEVGRDRAGQSPAQRVNLAALVHEALAISVPAAHERSVNLERHGFAAPVLVLGTAPEIRQILLNLLSNAVKFSPAEGKVRIILHSDGPVRLMVEDEGPGVPISDRERIFDRRERLNSRSSGHGLGLAISRRHAQAMGGRLWVEGASGGGARFVLELRKA